MFRIIEREDIGRALVAARDLPAGVEVGHYGGSDARVIDHPTMHTVQLSTTRHAIADDGLELVAHSCDPSCHMVPFFADPEAAGAARKAVASDDTNVGCPREEDSIIGFRLVTARPIPDGGVISFDYTTTEWSMAAPFECACGARNCLRWVRGFAHLAPEAQRARLGGLSPYIRAKAAEEERRGAHAYEGLRAATVSPSESGSVGGSEGGSVPGRDTDSVPPCGRDVDFWHVVAEPESV